MQQKYLSEIIGSDYRGWKQKKIFLEAPTGMGKTTFILQEILPYVNARGGKLLILCNRKLLREQYWYALIRQFKRYSEFVQAVEVKTYQQLAEEVKSGVNVRTMFAEYELICCDETHYFYADSDFNGFGTYVLLQTIVLASIAKTTIFMTATMDEVKPLIKKTISNCMRKLRYDGDDMRLYDGCEETVTVDLGYLVDYSRFKCFSTPDIKSLCSIAAKADKKTIIFIDDKRKALEMKETIEKCGVRAMDVMLLNSKNLEESENGNLVRNLAMNHKVLPKVLITTSVLDNGVSIESSEVGNIAIITESQISFLQMLGRVRVGYAEKCNLYFVERGSEYFEKRVEQYKAALDFFEKIDAMKLWKNCYGPLSVVWENSNEELADAYRRSLVLSRQDIDFYSLGSERVILSYGNSKLSVNEFAREKIGNMYMTESLFYEFSVDNPLHVIYEQMSWIGKKPDELTVLESEYLKERKEDMLKILRSVHDYSLEQLKEVKERLAKEYRTEFFSEIVFKNQSFSQDKLAEICRKYHLRLLTKTGVDKRARYYIIAEGVQDEE